MRTNPSPTVATVTAAVTIASLAATGGALAGDARSVALGGSVVANGDGVPGVLANPASLMRLERGFGSRHLSLGLSAEFRDDAGLIDIATDPANESIVSDVDDTIATINGSRITCLSPEATPDTPCLTGLAPLSRLTGRLLDLAETVDGEDVAVQGDGAVGFALTGSKLPFAVHLEARFTGRGRADIAEDDKSYLRDITEDLADDDLTVGEINDSAQFAFDEVNQQLQVVQPEDVLQSSGEGGGIARVTLGASFARSFAIAGLGVDIGLTPKLSGFVASSADVTAADEFAENSPTLDERLEASEVEGTSFTFDVGASTRLIAFPVRVAAVLRNVVPESIKTGDGFAFETTPQLVVGGYFDALGPVNFNVDLALNEAEVDGFPTQLVALGAEFAVGPIVALRGGINHDAARAEAPTALSLGLGLGPLDIGARASSVENMQLAAQLALSF